ncbi:MAG: MFS transporter [Renibacterium sp.]|nr:MFS transporter [Renibacterium sp.]
MAAIDADPARNRAARDSALSEPTTLVGPRWSTWWSLAALGMYVAYYGAQQIVLPRQSNAITSNSAEAVSAQAWANVGAAVVTIVVSVLVGAFSDRTTYRRGRRQAWVLGGALVLGVALILQGQASSVWLLVLLWSLAQVGVAATYSALTAAVADEVPVRQRARISSLLGISQSVGPLVGIALVTTVFLDITWAYTALGLVAFLLALPFAFGTRGIALQKTERQPLNLKILLLGILSPLKHRDFAWAWGGRFFIQLSNALGQLYLYQFLQDRVHFDPDLGTLILIVVYALSTVIACIPAGRISDRTGRRKRMVFIASVLQGVAGLFFMFLPTLAGAIIGAAVLGLGYGAYIAVDQALITQVLPNAEDRGKDLGVINIANTLPYVLAAALGGLVINEFGGYFVLYFLVLVTGVLAALTVRPIRSVR